jgi:hypothetical protein
VPHQRVFLGEEPSFGHELDYGLVKDPESKRKTNKQRVTVRWMRRLVILAILVLAAIGCAYMASRSPLQSPSRYWPLACFAFGLASVGYIISWAPEKVHINRSQRQD